MICDECGANSRHLRYRYSQDGERTERGCDECLTLKRPTVNDVYYKTGETSHPHIWDKENGRPYTYNSRSEKAAIMKKLNISEAGDPVRGAR